LAFALADTEDAPGIGVKVRELDLTQPAPVKVSSYRLAALGVVLGDGAQVVAVTENSPALFAGMAQGDRILAVNGQTMDLAALEALEIDAAVMVLVQAPDGSTRHVFLDPWGGKDGVRPVGGANVLDPDVVVF
jgi:serine protease Do